MKRRNHLSPISRMPHVAQDEDQIIKLGTISTIIDRFLLIGRQKPWGVGCWDSDGCGGDDGGAAGGGAAGT